MTIAELKALDFGYLKGADLLQWAAAQLLIKQYEVDPDSLQNGYIQAESEVVASFATKYDMNEELAKTTGRSNLLVKLLSILAVRNILGNMQNISDKMMSDFQWADSTVRGIRNGQINLPIKSASTSVASTAYLVNSSFSTLG